jgi:hypothetical protein
MRIHLLLLVTFCCNEVLSQNYLNSTSKWHELLGNTYDTWWQRSTYYIHGDGI